MDLDTITMGAFVVSLILALVVHLYAHYKMFKEKYKTIQDVMIKNASELINKVDALEEKIKYLENEKNERRNETISKIPK